MPVRITTCAFSRCAAAAAPMDGRQCRARSSCGNPRVYSRVRAHDFDMRATIGATRSRRQSLVPRRPAQPKPAAPSRGRRRSTSCRSSACARPPVVANDPAAARDRAADAEAQRRRRQAAPRTAKLAPAGALPPARIPPEALVAPRNDKLLALGGRHLGRDPRGRPVDPLRADRHQGSRPRAAARGGAGQREDQGQADQGRRPGAGEPRRRRQHRRRPAREVAAAGAAEGQRAERDHRRDAEARRRSSGRRRRC